MHEDRQIGVGASRQCFGDLIGAMQDGLHELMVRRSWRAGGNLSSEDFQQAVVGFEIGWAGDDGRDQTVDGADADIVFTAVPAKDQVHFLIGEERRRHAAAFDACASRSAFQFQARSSCSRSFVVLPETMRSRTSVSQVSRSTPLSFVV